MDMMACVSEKQNVWWYPLVYKIEKRKEISGENRCETSCTHVCTKTCSFVYLPVKRKQLEYNLDKPLAFQSHCPENILTSCSCNKLVVAVTAHELFVTLNVAHQHTLALPVVYLFSVLILIDCTTC